MRITSFSFLFFLKLVLFSQNTCENIPIISLDSLSNFSSTSEIEYFKVQEDSIFDSFSFTSGFQSVNLYFDTCNSLNKLVLDSNGLVIPTDEMINSGMCFCKSCVQRYSNISLQKALFIEIIKPLKLKILKHKKIAALHEPWYEKELKSGDKIRLQSILFVGGEARFRPISYQDLNRLYNVLAKNFHLKIEIQGHVNSPGKRNTKKNQALSEARSKAVMNYLIQKGIKSDRLTSVGYGNTRMIYSNTKLEYEMQFNRRVEILVK